MMKNSLQDVQAPEIRKPRKPVSFWSVVSIAAVGLFAILLFYPLARLAIISFSSGDGGNFFEIYSETLGKPYYYQGLFNSLILGAAATGIALLIGIPFAYIVTRFNVPGKLFIRSAVVLTFISPPFIGAYSWILVLGDAGFLRSGLESIGIHLPSIYGWFGLIIVLSLQGIPFIFLMVSSALKSVDQSVEDAAINLGHSPIRVIFKAILPLIIPGISTGALLVFVTSFADFGTPAILGRNLRVFPRIIYEKFINETTGGEFEVASALAVVMIVIAIGALLLQRWYSRKHSYGQECIRPLAVRSLSGMPRFFASAFSYFIIFVACLPLVTVVVTSFIGDRPSTRGQISLDAYIQSVDLWSSLWNTFYLTTISTVICVTIGALIGYVVARRSDGLGRFIDASSMIPYAIAGVVMGIAFSIGFGNSPFFLGGTAVILILVYLARRLPYSVRSVAGMLSQVGTQTEEASVNLGVSPGRTFWKITVPMISGAMISGALLTWATIAREFNATVILYGVDTKTLPVGVFTDVLYGNFAQASARGTILILVSLIPVVILFRSLGKDEDILI